MSQNYFDTYVNRIGYDAVITTTAKTTTSKK